MPSVITRFRGTSWHVERITRRHFQACRGINACSPTQLFRVERWPSLREALPLEWQSLSHTHSSTTENVTVGLGSILTSYCTSPARLRGWLSGYVHYEHAYRRTPEHAARGQGRLY